MSSDQWQTVRFGDVAREIKEKVDPETGDLERYVAGGHMDTDDLRIRQWGEIGDGYLGPAFHRRFIAGQILYGSRRTYLRKVAVADFDGVCANTTFVIEAIPERIHRPLLPFIMQSEPFVEHSILNSRGSTNPYVTWKDIAKYEFPLPPLDEQQRIAELLWAVEDVINAWQLAIGGLKKLRLAHFNKAFADVPIDSMVSLDGLLNDTQYGTSERASATDSSGYPILRIPNVLDGKINLDDLKWINLSDDDLSRYSLNPDDILIVRTNGNPDYVGRCTVVGSSVPENTVFASYLIRLRVAQRGMNNANLINYRTWTFQS